jgi:transposase
MSLLNSISNLLNIKDPNITFQSNFCKEEVIRGVSSKIIEAKLSYTPPACTHCGHVKDENIIKHGFKTSLITLPSICCFW